jgi:hypothetical protein
MGCGGRPDCNGHIARNEHRSHATCDGLKLLLGQGADCLGRRVAIRFMLIHLLLIHAPSPLGYVNAHLYAAGRMPTVTPVTVFDAAWTNRSRQPLTGS